MKRALPLLLTLPVALLLLWPRTAPRPSSQLGAGTTGFGATTGAPHPVEPTVGPTPGVVAGPTTGNSGGAPTPHPTTVIDAGGYCSDPPDCGYVEPTPKPRPVTVKASGGIRGQASWWYSFGPGLYAAIRPDLGTKGDLAIVCGGSPFHCLTLPVITTCACLGPNSDRLIDLSRDAFASFAPPSQGVVQVTVRVVRR